jgi:hypothetical protein
VSATADAENVKVVDQSAAQVGSLPSPADGRMQPEPASCQAATVPVFFDDMEGDVNDWTATGFWHQITNPQTISVYHAGAATPEDPPNDVSPDLAASFSLEFYDDGAGLLHIALADDALVSGSGALATVHLRIASDAPVGASVPLALAEARLNDITGRDFATSSLQRTVGRRSGELSIEQHRIYLPLTLRNYDNLSNR